MFKRSLLMLVVSALSIYAGKQKGEGKVDSMVYDQPTEWRVFSVDGAAEAFAVQGDLLWIAAEAQVASLSIHNAKKNDVQRYKTLGTMSSAGIKSIVVDKQGRVWFGGKEGVAMKNGTQFTIFSTKNGLSDDNVTAIVAAADGSVWVGTENGVNLYQGGSWKTYSAKDGLVSNKIQALMVDAKGSVWCGTDKGIGVFSGSKWTSYTMKNGMSWNDTKALGCDQRSGHIWAAVGEKDVNSFDGTKWNVFMDIQAGITSIMVDSQGRVWFGSPTGLVKFNNEEWISDAKQLGVPASQVNQMYVDGEGNLWFAMETGVVRLANPYPH
jgi:two-component system, sensor histidine kinase ChiS